jgi:outer membrane receptor protein involved in Fe transport
MIFKNAHLAFSIFAVAISVSPGATGQEPPSDTLSSAEQTQQAMPIPSPAVSRMDRGDITDTPTPEAATFLRPLPGIYVQHPLPQAGSLSLRGQTGNRNIIRVDGVRYANGLQGTFPNQHLASINPGFINQVQVSRGASSFFLANGGLGNVIDIRLTEPTLFSKGPHGDGTLYYSSGTHSAGMHTGAHLIQDSHAVTLGASYFSYGDLRAGNGDKLPFTGFEQASWFVKLKLQPEESPVKVTGGYLGQIADDRPRTDQLDYGTLQLFNNQDNLVYINVYWDPSTVLKRLNIVASYHQSIEKIRRFNCPLNGTSERIDFSGCRALTAANNAQKNRDTVDSFGIDASSQLALYKDRLFVHGNIEYYFDNIISSMEAFSTYDEARPTFRSQNRGLYSTGSYFSKFGTAVGVDAQLIKTRAGDLWIQLGGRFSHFAAYAPLVPGIDEDIHYTGSGFSDTATLMWAYQNLFSIWGAYTTGLRPASLQETTANGYVDGMYQIPDVEIDEELADIFETGAELNLKYVQLGTVWFYNRIDNYIDAKPALLDSNFRTSDFHWVFTNYNTDHAVFKGVENSLTITLGGVSLFGTLTWQKGTVYNNSEGYMAELTNNANHYPARRMPRLFGSAGLRYKHPNQRFYASLTMDWSDAQHRLHPFDKRDPAICGLNPRTRAPRVGCDQVAGYYTFNFNGGVQVTSNADVSVSIQNLLDRNYRTIGSSLREPGFDARAMFRLHF